MSPCGGKGSHRWPFGMERYVERVLFASGMRLWIGQVVGRHESLSWIAPQWNLFGCA
jgi:hypothetical protein